MACKSTDLYFIKLYHRDLLSSPFIVMLGPSGVGMYLFLLAFQWDQGSLPTSTDMLKKIARASDSEWELFEPFLDQLFPIIDGNIRLNAKYAEVRVQVHKQVTANRNNGSQGGRPKNPSVNPRGNPSPNPQGNPRANQTRDKKLDTRNKNQETLWDRLSPLLPEPFQTEIFKEALDVWDAYRVERSFPAFKDVSITKLVKKWSKFEPQEVMDAFDVSIENNFQGCFPKKTSDNRQPSMIDMLGDFSK